MRLIESEINQLKHFTLEMAELVQLQFDYLVQAVQHKDPVLAEKIKKKEQEIDAFDNRIDRRCARILALYQPVANDLRFVFSVVKINGYLEQMGDLINYISRKTLKFEEEISADLIQELRLMQMLECTRKIISGAVSAFFQEDTERTRAIFPMDDAVDEIHKASFEIIARHIEANPARVRTLMQLLINIKSVEKIADLGVNIAEEALFNTEAVVVKHSEVKNAHRNPTPKPETPA